MMANHSSDLAPLLAAWGVDYDATKVIGDLQRGLEVRTSMQSPPVRHIGILGLGHGDMNQKDVVSASLEKINLATAGSLAPRPGAKTTSEPVPQTSAIPPPTPPHTPHPLNPPPPTPSLYT